jgi:tetratricopeptide (TPR) repeat protein
MLLLPESNASDEVRRQADMRSIRIAYYRGDFDTVLARLEPVTSELRSDAANDAIELSVFLKAHLPGGKEPLVLFSKAQFLAIQRKNSEALAVLDDILQRFKSTLLFDDVLLEKAHLFRMMGRWPEAIQACERLVNEYGESIYTDKALFLIAEITERDAGKKEEAIRAFERFLERFPSSFLADDARKRIRRLRGESI